MALSPRELVLAVEDAVMLVAVEDEAVVAVDRIAVYAADVAPVITMVSLITACAPYNWRSSP